MATSVNAAPTDLLRDTQAWSVVTPYAPHGMTFTRSEKQPGLEISAQGYASPIGGWVRSLPALTKGRRYRFTASCELSKISAPQRRVRAMVDIDGKEYMLLRQVERKDDRQALEIEFTAAFDVRRPKLRLYLADVATGGVVWKSATMEDVTAGYQPRVVHLAAISGRAPNPHTTTEAVDFYLARLDAVGSKGGIDLVCLPENMNVDGVEGDHWKMLETIPGPTTQRLAEKARQYHMYICASIAERDGDVRYNTAVLLDREGRLVGKYRKTHLTTGEHLISGISEGAEFVVCDTDFGKVGLMVCYDYQFPEVARILALKGAEIIAMPIAADGREQVVVDGESEGSLWEPLMRARAVDNNVFIVASVNFGRSMIVAPNGEVLAKNRRFNRDPGGLVEAACPMELSAARYTGQAMGDRMLQLRRPEIYTPILRDIDGDWKAPLPAPVREAGH